MWICQKPFTVCIGRHFGEVYFFSQQSISDHMIWLLQNLYNKQTEQIVGTNESRRLFDIKRGVRQGCVLSPRLFCAVLEMAMGMWRGTVGRLGVDLGEPLRCQKTRCLREHARNARKAHKCDGKGQSIYQGLWCVLGRVARR